MLSAVAGRGRSPGGGPCDETGKAHSLYGRCNGQRRLREGKRVKGYGVEEICREVISKTEEEQNAK